jgi:hypothetical protein
MLPTKTILMLTISDLKVTSEISGTGCIWNDASRIIQRFGRLRMSFGITVDFGL